MSYRRLAEAMERFLEDDAAATDGNGGSSASDSDLRAQVRTLSQTCDQLKQQVSSMQNNFMYTAILPALTKTKLTVVSDDHHVLPVGDNLSFSNSDPLTALLPMLLMGGMDSSGAGSSDSMMPIALLAALGKL